MYEYTRLHTLTTSTHPYEDDDDEEEEEEQKKKLCLHCNTVTVCSIRDQRLWASDMT